MDHTKLIESAIESEIWARDTAAAEDKHFWNGWTPEAVRAGHVVATVTTSAAGTGYLVVVTRRLIVQSSEGVALATVPDSECTERVSSRDTRRAGGLESYARKLVAKHYGADMPMKTHHQH